MLAPIIEFRRRLEAGEIMFGPGVYLTDPLISEMLADSCDFLWYDLEHQLMSNEALRNHLMAARGKQTPSIVRVPGPHPGPVVLKPILDAGAGGIVVPQVKTVDEVRQIVNNCRYPPMGERGTWPMIPTNYTRDDIDEYYAQANKYLFVSIMIETKEAAEAIDDIIAIDGLDGVCLGLADLSGSFGVMGQTDHPKVIGAAERVIASCKAAGKPVGMGQGTNVDVICEMFDRGIQWMQTGADCVYMVEFLTDFATKIKQRVK